VLAAAPPLPPGWQITLITAAAALLASALTATV
jgi:hypothetical protein